MWRKNILNELLLDSFLSNGSVSVRLYVCVCFEFFFSLSIGWTAIAITQVQWTNPSGLSISFLYNLCVRVCVCSSISKWQLCNQFMLSKWCGWIFITKVIVNGNWTQSRPINGHFVLHLQPENGHYLLHTYIRAPKTRCIKKSYRPNRKRWHSMKW